MQSSWCHGELLIAHLRVAEMAFQSLFAPFVRLQAASFAANTQPAHRLALETVTQHKQRLSSADTNVGSLEEKLQNGLNRRAEAKLV